MVEQDSQMNEENQDEEEDWDQDEWDDAMDQQYGDEDIADVDKIKKELAQEAELRENQEAMDKMREDMKQANEDALKDLPNFRAKMLSVQEILKALDWSKEKNEEAICPICQCELIEGLTEMDQNQIDNLVEQQRQNMEVSGVVMLPECKGHAYHLECLKQQISSGDGSGIKCAACGHFYGVIKGDGTLGRSSMVYSLQNSLCQGYNCKTWVISYHVLPCAAKAQFCSGESRNGFIPDTPEGREVLALFIIAFERQLTFVCGFSVTRNRDNCIVWNGIHHKTSVSGGSSSWGYPDETYFTRVKDELKQKNVIFKSESERDEHIQKAIANAGKTIFIN